jgi:pentatricopeptide repeat protein
MVGMGTFNVEPLVEAMMRSNLNKGWEDTLESFSEIKRSKTKLGAPQQQQAFSLAVAAHAHLGDWKAASSLLAEMLDENFVIDVSTYDHVIDAISVAGEPEELHAFLLSMRKDKGLAPISPLSFAASIACFARYELWDRVLLCFQWIQEDGVERGLDQDPNLWAVILLACQKTGRFELGTPILDAIKRSGVVHNHFSRELAHKMEALAN